MKSIWQDTSYAFRTLAKSPGFTLIALLTLSIGIGANAAIFTLVDSVLLRPLPYPQPDRLVRVYDLQPHDEKTTADYPEFLDWRGHQQIFQAVSAYFPANYDLTGQGEATRLVALRASANLLPTYGIQPNLGRGFRPEEETRSAERVCLISDALWQTRFAHDPGILGKTLRLDEYPFTVIGVLPRNAVLPGNPDVVSALRLDQTVAPRGFHFLTVIGRLRAGLSLDQARKEIEPFAAELRKERSIDHGLALLSLKQATMGSSGTPLLVMLGAVGCVLLIVCANLANLLLTRAQSRRREVAIRVALGAAPRRIVQQFFTESALLAIAGGVLGMFVSAGLTAYLLTTGLGTLPRVREIHPDAAVYGFTALLVLLTALLFGLSPALVALKSSSIQTLKEGGRGTGSRSGNQRNVLVVAEVALSLVLLIGAGLLLRSFDELSKVSKGFDPANVLTFDLSLPASRYAKPEQQVTFVQRLTERLKALPAVDSVGTINTLVLSPGNVNGSVAIEGKTFPRGSEPVADKRIAGSEYFRALRIPLMAGRYFNERDSQGAPAVVIINQAFAIKYFPGEDPLGKHVDFQWDTPKGYQEIVGVIGNVKHDGLQLPSNAEIYVPYAQRPDSSFGMTLRTQSDPTAVLGAVREQISQSDAGLAMAHVKTLEQVVDASVADQRLRLMLLGSFALVALFLAAVGLYGVIAFAVSARTHEIGIRMAIGALPRSVLWMVVSEGLRLGAIGTLIGLAAALALTRFLSTLLFNVKPTDTVTYVVLAAGILLIALAASYFPARRATRVDPLIALRYE